MTRLFTALILLVGASASCQAAETLEVSGVITYGRVLGAGRYGPVLDVPLVVTSPFPYVGRLTYQPEISDARFEFVFDPDGFAVEHVVGLPQGLDGANLFPGIEKYDANILEIDFLPPFGTPISILDFALDRATGLGAWEWREYCSGCRAALPQATATITSYRVVPEPSTACLAIIIAAIGVGRIRRRSAALPVR